MRTTLLVSALCIGLASAAHAGELFGTVSENGRPLPQGTTLKLDCGGASASGSTDQFGSYRIQLNASGECSLSIAHKGSSPSLKVTLFDKPTRYDLVVKDEAGKVTVSRK